MTTHGATSEDKVVKFTTFGFQCIMSAIWLGIQHAHRVTYAVGIWYVPCLTFAVGMSPMWYHARHVTYDVGIWYVRCVSYVVNRLYMSTMWHMLWIYDICPPCDLCWGYILMPQCKPSVTPLLTHWRYCSLAMWLMLRIYIMSRYICNVTNDKLRYLLIASWNIFGVFICTDMHSFFRLIGIYSILTCIFMCYPTCANQFTYALSISSHIYAKNDNM